MSKVSCRSGVFSAVRPNWLVPGKLVSVPAIRQKSSMTISCSVVHCEKAAVVRPLLSVSKGSDTSW